MSVDSHCSHCFTRPVSKTSLEIASMCVRTRSWSQIDRLTSVAMLNYFIKVNIDVTCTRDAFIHNDLKKTTQKSTHNDNMLSTTDVSTNTVIVTLQRP